MPPKKYQTSDQKKAADKERKRLQRASKKNENLLNLTNPEWISQILHSLADDVTYKIHRKSNNSSQRALKRAAEKQSTTDISKRKKSEK